MTEETRGENEETYSGSFSVLLSYPHTGSEEELTVTNNFSFQNGDSSLSLEEELSQGSLIHLSLSNFHEVIESEEDTFGKDVPSYDYDEEGYPDYFVDFLLHYEEQSETWEVYYGYFSSADNLRHPRTIYRLPEIDFIASVEYGWLGTSEILFEEGEVKILGNEGEPFIHLLEQEGSFIDENGFAYTLALGDSEEYERRVRRNEALLAQQEDVEVLRANYENNREPINEILASYASSSEYFTVCQVPEEVSNFNEVAFVRVARLVNNDESEIREEHVTEKEIAFFEQEPDEYEMNTPFFYGIQISDNQEYHELHLALIRGTRDREDGSETLSIRRSVAFPIVNIKKDGNTFNVTVEDNQDLLDVEQQTYRFEQTGRYTVVDENGIEYYLDSLERIGRGIREEPFELYPE